MDAVADTQKPPNKADPITQPPAIANHVDPIQEHDGSAGADTEHPTTDSVDAGSLDIAFLSVPQDDPI